MTAKQFKPDLILLDMIMPDFDGGTVAAQLKKDSEMSRVPILILTAIVSKEEALQHGERISSFPCLAKPVTLAELNNTINLFL